MINLNLLEAQIEEFFEVSGDDISSVINHETSLSFSHVSLINKNASYDVTLNETGAIKLSKKESISSESFLNQNTESASAKTLLKEVVVIEEKANNIQDVISFISRAAA